MTSLNKVTLIGNLGGNPEIRKSNTGGTFATFSVATHEAWINNEGVKRQEVEWHRITILSPHIAEFAGQYLKKGDRVYIEGQLKSHVWINKEDIEVKTVGVLITKFRGELMLLSKKVDQIPQDSESSCGAAVAEAVPTTKIKAGAVA